MYKGRIYLTIRGSTLFLPNGNTFFTIITVSPGLIGTARRWSSLALLLGHFQHMCPSLEKPVTGTFLFNALSKVYFKKLTVSRRKFYKKPIKNFIKTPSYSEYGLFKSMPYPCVYNTAFICSYIPSASSLYFLRSSFAGPDSPKVSLTPILVILVGHFSASTSATALPVFQILSSKVLHTRKPP